MIVALSKYFLLSGLALMASWAAVAYTTTDWGGTLEMDERAYHDAFPGAPPIGRLEGNALASAMIPSPLRASLQEPGFQGLLALLSIAQVHSQVAAHAIPVLLLALVSGTLLGATLRERIRYGSGYASPTVAFVAKRLLIASLGYFLVWALSPIPGAYGTIYLPPAVGFVGAAFYAANLPVRL